MVVFASFFKSFVGFVLINCKITEADPGEGLKGCNPPLGSICFFFCLILPKIIKKMFFNEVDSLPSIDCLSSYEKIMYISRLSCRVLLVRRSF